MLYSYNYIIHDLEKMQTYMDYIFFEVWLKAKKHDEFSLSLFEKKSELKEIIFYFFYKDDSPKYGKEFVEKVLKIFNIFKSLNSYELKLLKKWYLSNNNLREICRGNKKPIRYTDIRFNDKLVTLLYELYKNLYDQNYLGLKNKEDHYLEFFKKNNIEYCSFCGLSEMKGDLHSKKEAYDHYLPQEKYPFNTINFHNLVPTCNTCNSSYKLRKDPLHLDDKIKRKAYYPFNNKIDSICIQVGFDINNEIILSFNSDDKEELETWKEIYGIEERYNAVCSLKKTGLRWLTDAKSYIKYYSSNIDDYIKYINYLLEENPSIYHEKRFLQVPFLKACKKAGIL